MAHKLIASTLNMEDMKDFIRAGRNVLVMGQHGTGKTKITQQAVEELGLSMQYFEGATMDPYIELIGVPVPDDDKQHIKMLRQRKIMDANVIFIDEMNRASERVLNALFELIQFRSINGERLPNLQCVVAAINPVSDEYTTEELDHALVDRFHIYLECPPSINFPYFSAKYNANVAKTVSHWWGQHHANYEKAKRNSSKGNTSVYISPRRMDMLVENFKYRPVVDTILLSLPLGSVETIPSGTIEDLCERLTASLGLGEEAENANTPEGVILGLVDPNDVSTESMLSVLKEAVERYERGESTLNETTWKEFLRHVALGLSGLNEDARFVDNAKGSAAVVDCYGFVLKHFSEADQRSMTGAWKMSFKRGVSKYFKDLSED